MRKCLECEEDTGTGQLRCTTCYRPMCIKCFYPEPNYVCVRCFALISFGTTRQEKAKIRKEIAIAMIDEPTSSFFGIKQPE